ncbi:MAG: hypothetical protein M9894_39700 [Planctomycetes bacterium]|nr:hypothetical protein [Planctomycetota bacterium]
MASGSMVEGVSSSDVEKVRLAVLALEAEGAPVTVRSVRSRAEVGQAVAQRVAKAYREGVLPPPADGPWCGQPWAAAADAKRRAQDASDLREALRAMLNMVHEDGLAGLAAAVWDAPCDLRRIAARAGGFSPAELEGHEVPEHPVCTVGGWLESLERVDASQ